MAEPQEFEIELTEAPKPQDLEEILEKELGEVKEEIIQKQEALNLEIEAVIENFDKPEVEFDIVQEPAAPVQESETVPEEDIDLVSTNLEI